MVNIVLRNAVKRRKNYLYYVDANGSICEASLCRTGRGKQNVKLETCICCGNKRRLYSKQLCRNCYVGIISNTISIGGQRIYFHVTVSKQKVLDYVNKQYDNILEKLLKEMKSEGV